MIKLTWILVLLISSTFSFAQSIDNIIDASEATRIVKQLADDEMKGRKTFSPTIDKAAAFIATEFKKSNLEFFPGSTDFLQTFSLTRTKFLSASGTINDTQILENNIIAITTEPLLKINEQSGYQLISFDTSVKLIAEAGRLIKEKKNYIVLVNSFHTANFGRLKRFKRDNFKTTHNVIFVLHDETPARYNFEIKHEVTSTALSNVVAVLPGKTRKDEYVIFSAHYDHLGYGEDRNSLYAGTSPMIHNGADDNASGTAALIELCKQLKASGNKKNNYLFIAFSGEELGLFGSKYFTEHPLINLSNVNYMINMDMVGRLNDSTRGLTIGGFGTSPAWNQLIDTEHRYFKIKLDSSGTGPSDHTSFYRKDIPVLFFFTGTHSDYHKPSDDADKINYAGQLQLMKYIFNLISKADSREKLAFTKTREAATTAKNSFKVSLGIMPDYTYSGTGVHVDGVSAGKAAEKAGIKTGDVIVQLGEHKVSDVQAYMSALGKFNKGEATKVKLIRGKEELVLDIVF